MDLSTGITLASTVVVTAGAAAGQVWLLRRQTDILASQNALMRREREERTRQSFELQGRRAVQGYSDSVVYLNNKSTHAVRVGQVLIGGKLVTEARFHFLDTARPSTYVLPQESGAIAVTQHGHLDWKQCAGERLLCVSSRPGSLDTLFWAHPRISRADPIRPGRDPP